MLSLINTLSALASTVGIIHLLQGLFTQKLLKAKRGARLCYYTFRAGLVTVATGQLLALLESPTYTSILTNIGLGIAAWTYTQAFEFALVPENTKDNISFGLQINSNKK